jgi:hypothetical protein
MNLSNTINGALWKAVQEHIDNNYNGSWDGDCIDWATASKEAHADLDIKFGAEAVDKAIKAYRS